jgi:ribosome-binding protein aMBF1 (putative translation factor)
MLLADWSKRRRIPVRGKEHILINDYDKWIESERESGRLSKDVLKAKKIKQEKRV